MVLAEVCQQMDSAPERDNDTDDLNIFQGIVRFENEELDLTYSNMNEDNHENIDPFICNNFKTGTRTPLKVIV